MTKRDEGESGVNSFLKLCDIIYRQPQIWNSISNSVVTATVTLIMHSIQD